MPVTVKGILMNAFDLIKEYGFIPNGARVYYLTRSQPPFLSEMVRYYYEHTHDIELLKYALPFLEIEYKYWMNTHAVELPGGHVLNRFYTDAKRPRPESYREDMHAVKDMTEDQSQSFFSDIIAGAESGEDFTSRWFTVGTDLRSIATRSFIPVGLNAVMYKFESNMIFFSNFLQHNPTIDFAQALMKRKSAIDTYLWNPDTFQWYDYSLTNNSQIMRSYPSNWFPVWAGAYDTAYTSQILESLENSGLLQIGGVLSTDLASGQQWDSPNTWAPHQSLIAEVLLQLNTPESIKLAETVARRWINTTYLGFKSTRMMHEKYNALIPGAAGEPDFFLLLSY
jgi:alpha,alpha-trehalase